MKKLMIAAAAVAMASVAMAECAEITCPFAYRIKLAGKTVVGKATASNTVTCVDGDCWAKPASLRIAGYFFGSQPAATGACGDTCGCIGADAYLENKVFWDANKKEVKFTTVAFDTFEILRNGGALNKAQILLKLDDLNLAGFGVYNPVTGRLKSANGFFAGKLGAPKCAGAYDSATCTEGTATTAKVFTLCEILDATGALNPVDAEAAIAYGRWNMAWKHDKVALASLKGTNWNKIVLPAAYVGDQPIAD